MTSLAIVVSSGLNELFYPLDREIQGVFSHVGEAYPEPTGFGAMARRTGRDIQPNLINNLLPKLHFGIEAFGAQKMPHVYPTEQTGITL